jgi:hypothetical protein
VKLWQALKSGLTLSLLILSQIGCHESKPSVDADSYRHQTAVDIEPREIDLGKVEPKQPDLTARFRVTNNTSKPVKILSIETSCGCTVVSVDRKQLGPGERATLSAHIESRLNGPKQATLRIRTDASSEVLSAVARWNTLEAITVLPRALSFGSVNAGSLPVTEMIRITPSDDVARDAQWHSKLQISDNSGGALVTESDAQDGSVQCRVTIRPSTEHGVGRASISIRYDQSPFVTVPVHWEVIDSIRTIPESDFVGTVSAGAPWASTVLIRASSHDLSGVRLMENCTEELQVENVNSRNIKCRISGKAPTTPGAFKANVLMTVEFDGQSRQLPFVVHGFAQ